MGHLLASEFVFLYIYGGYNCSFINFMGHNGHFISHGGQVICSLFDDLKIPN
jgi:hypothetical protein